MRRPALAAIALLFATVLTAAPVAAATPQTITFTLPASGTLDDSFPLTATADSGLEVTYIVTTPATCSVVAGTLALEALGTCSVTASQAGDATYEPAPDVTRQIEILAASDAPQTIDFSLPASGVVGGSVDLEATASSGLEVTFASATPGVCTVTGTTARLEILGTCAVIASQPGNDIWLPAPDVRAQIVIGMSPVSSGINLGRLALNGPVMSSVIDPDTGTTYVVGPFTEIGTRTGNVAVVTPPPTGGATVKATNPEVVGTQVAVLPDDDTGYFVVGSIASINGDGVERYGTERMTSAGVLDKTWAVADPCATNARAQWSVGEWLVAPIEMAKDTHGYSTMGIQLIDKATGAAHATGAGGQACAASGRRWASVAPWAPLAACKTWTYCAASVLGVTLDPTTQTLIVDVFLVAGHTPSDVRDRHYLVGYDTVAGTRLWTLAPQDPTTSQYGFISAMTAFGGAALVVGDLRPDPTTGTTSTMALIDARTGTILQRWNHAGEQSTTDPSSVIAPKTPCTPAYDDVNSLVRFDFVRLDDARVIGYGLNTASGPIRDTRVCEYGLTGTGVDARLRATSRGILGAHLDREERGWLPSALWNGRYLVGGFDAFDLLNGISVVGWSPEVSIGSDTSVVALPDAVVLGGSFNFLHGTAVNYAVALDRHLDPIDTFQAEIGNDHGNPPWIRSATIAGGRLIVVGILGQGASTGPAIALDLATGQRVWGETTGYRADPFSVTPTPDGTGFYAAGEWLDGTDQTAVLRYLPSGDGFVRDPDWHPVFGGLGANHAVVTGVSTVGDHIYVGGNFTSIDGHPRQALARFDASGALEAWAPKLIDELKIPAGAAPELYARAFLESGGKVVIAGTFQWILANSGVTPSASSVLAYNATTGARVKPTGGNAPWFPVGYDWGAYDLDELNGTIYVALGNSGVGAFDAATLAYVPQRSIRTAMPTDAVVYAIQARPPADTMGIQSTGAPPPPDESLVVGGSISAYGKRSASNVLELSVDTTGPLVIARTPAKVSTGVRRNTNILVTFSENVALATAGVTLTDMTTLKRIAVASTYDARTRTVSLNPSALLPAGRTIKVSVTSTVKDAAGNAVTPVSWTFRVSTDATKPVITRRRPLASQTGVARTSNVVVTFSEKVVVSPTRIRIRDAITGGYLSAQVTLASDGKTATLNPVSHLRVSRRYTVLVSGVTDLAGNPVTTTSWTFTTGR